MCVHGLFVTCGWCVPCAAGWTWSPPGSVSDQRCSSPSSVSCSLDLHLERRRRVSITPSLHEQLTATSCFPQAGYNTQATQTLQKCTSRPREMRCFLQPWGGRYILPAVSSDQEQGFVLSACLKPLWTRSTARSHDFTKKGSGGELLQHQALKELFVFSVKDKLMPTTGSAPPCQNKIFTNKHTVAWRWEGIWRLGLRAACWSWGGRKQLRRRTDHTHAHTHTRCGKRVGWVYSSPGPQKSTNNSIHNVIQTLTFD